MRFLLLDAGNSALKWAVVGANADAAAEDFPGTAGGVIAYCAAAADGSLERDLAAACAGQLADSVLVLGCSVTAEARLRAIDAALGALGAPAPTWLAAQERFDHGKLRVDNGYRTPAQLGADRWHALLGVRALLPSAAAVVVNAGTATTVDALDAQGRFRGGVIAPGVDLMRAALARGTAQLPLAAGNYAVHADNTDDAIRTGILDAQLGLIERRVRRAEEALGARVQIVLSGGHAPTLDPMVRALLGAARVRIEPWIVLRGLHLRAQALWIGSERTA